MLVRYAVVSLMRNMYIVFFTDTSFIKSLPQDHLLTTIPTGSSYAFSSWS